MRIDITSMFFNSKIEGQTATPAWGTSIGQSKSRDCRIDDFKQEIVDMVIGMTYKSVSDLSNLDVSKGSSDREILICSVFNNIFVNNIKIEDSQYVLLLVREHSQNHDGRLLVTYAPYIKYNNIENKLCIDKMQHQLGCNADGCWFVYDISIKNQSDLHFSAIVVNNSAPMVYSNIKSKERSEIWKSLIPFDEQGTLYVTPESIQQIFYGAPGTGKSFIINKKTENDDVIRTTFHPDSDYSTFVGAYKPTTKEIPMRDVTGKVIFENGKAVTENRIIYEFVDQAFLQAYVAAWKKIADNQAEPQRQYLVIEEINRGNCAQIFGDLFQLLDRNNEGFSEYPIKADADMKKQIKKRLDGLNFDNPEQINALYKEKDIVSQVLAGDILLLPNNLYIWATMNTSDQSLFPIDSAFKRRWDWQYIKIDEGKQKDSSKPLGWKILVEDDEQDQVRLYDWWRFLQLINVKILDATESADKQMGYFFAKATESFKGEKLGVIKNGKFEQDTNELIHHEFITAETFVNKVLFYLWSDVLKENEYEEISNLMKDGENHFSFPDFFGETGKEISPSALRVFLDNVMNDEDIWCEIAEWNLDSPKSNSNSSFSFQPKSVIFKITDDIRDSNLLYERARGSWRMAKNRANETEYIYVYSTPIRKITACYKVINCIQEPHGDKFRFKFEGTPVNDDPMIGQPVESISHSRGQVVFYPDNLKKEES